MNTNARREQRPDPTQGKGNKKAEIPLNDPNYHYRIVSKEHEVRDRAAYHRELGYGSALETNRHIVMGCKRDEHDQRQREAADRAERMQRSGTPSGDGLCEDRTSIEVTRGLIQDDD